MNFRKKHVDTKTLSELLLEVREHFELSYEEVVKAAQVQKNHLIALESGDYKNLPADVYVKGYLRSLAKLYQMDEQMILTQFEEERGIERNLDQVRVPDQQDIHFSQPRFVFSSRTLVVAGALLLGVISLGYLYFQVSSLRAAPMLELASPENDGTTDSSIIVVRGKTEPGAVVYINNQPIVVDAEGDFLENISLAPGTNQLEIKSKNRFDQETTLKRSIVYQEKIVAGTSTPQNLIDEPDSRIEAEVIIGPESAWVSLSVDGQEVYSGTMLENSQQTVRAQQTVTLTTGNAGSTKVILNGKDLGVVGAKGEVARDLEFTATSTSF